jgi:hypothetical protein
MEPTKVEIYEVNYSVSPGGIDEWEMNIHTPQNYVAHFSEFKTASEALEFAMEHYPTRELSVSIKSLEWYEYREAKGEYANN